MKRFFLVLQREFSYQWHSLTGLTAALFFTFLLIFISGYAFNYIQTKPDSRDIAIVFSLIFLISTQFSVSFLGMRSRSFLSELKILPFTGANVFLCRLFAIFAGIVVINIVSVPAFVVFFNLDVSYIAAFMLFVAVILVAIAQVSLGLITQFSYVSGSKHLSSYALILTLPLLIPVFTAQLYAVKNILMHENVNLREILIIIGLDILYFASGLVIFEFTSKN